MAAPDDVDAALIAYLQAAAQSNTGLAKPVADALAEGLRAKLGEKIKFNNIMNQIVANEGYLHGLSLGKTLGVPFDKIMPYPGYGSVNNFQVGAPAAAPVEPRASEPAVKPADPQQPKSSWLPWALSAGLLAGGTGLAGYLLADKPVEPAAIQQPSGPEIDPSVGIQIDG